MIVGGLAIVLISLTLALIGTLRTNARLERQNAVQAEMLRTISNDLRQITRTPTVPAEFRSDHARWLDLVGDGGEHE